MARYRPPEGATQRSRGIRKEPTDAETRMWSLRRHCLPDAHFRRQAPIRKFTADFASHGLKLVVEVDGGQHSEKRDGRRTALIEAEGYRVLHFWNHDVLSKGDGVATFLAPYCGDASPTHEHRPAIRSHARGHGDLLILPHRGGRD